LSIYLFAAIYMEIDAHERFQERQMDRSMSTRRNISYYQAPHALGVVHGQ
jgi:hypothetical protein